MRDYSIICAPNSLHRLCNECFQKTYSRVKVYPKDEASRMRLGWSPAVTHVEISVVKALNETVESVLQELHVPIDCVTWGE